MSLHHLDILIRRGFRHENEPRGRSLFGILVLRRSKRCCAARVSVPPHRFSNANAGRVDFGCAHEARHYAHSNSDLERIFPNFFLTFFHHSSNCLLTFRKPFSATFNKFRCGISGKLSINEMLIFSVKILYYSILISKIPEISEINHRKR